MKGYIKRRRLSGGKDTVIFVESVINYQQWEVLNFGKRGWRSNHSDSAKLYMVDQYFLGIHELFAVFISSTTVALLTKLSHVWKCRPGHGSEHFQYFSHVFLTAPRKVQITNQEKILNCECSQTVGNNSEVADVPDCQCPGGFGTIFSVTHFTFRLALNRSGSWTRRSL